MTRVQYEDRLREIDLNILSQVVTQQAASTVGAKTSNAEDKNDDKTEKPHQNKSKSSNGTNTKPFTSVKHSDKPKEPKKNTEHHFCKKDDE